ncbi:hypothetical protein VNO78_02757 [Psophocarpus tetragonolobus]|uniref:Uncharacterized protein n=1 Tax=Psophocarpus tetragonolobus TaxID=3891 RepID=A0AAN9T1U7_PSOTE
MRLRLLAGNLNLGFSHSLTSKPLPFLPQSSFSLAIPTNALSFSFFKRSVSFAAIFDDLSLQEEFSEV